MKNNGGCACSFLAAGMLLFFTNRVIPIIIGKESWSVKSMTAEKKKGVKNGERILHGSSTDSA